MEHFVAYHSGPYMKDELKPTNDNFGFYSRKRKSQLLRIIGNNVWMISGTRDRDKRMIYRLHGFYIASRVSQAQDSRFLHLVSGTEVHVLKLPVTLNDFVWFWDLYKEQNNFSLGMNKIRDGKVVAQLEKLMS